MSTKPAIWFPTVRTGTGTDVFTERLVAGLQARGFHAEITWLPLRAEYAPWSVPKPQPPDWANICHINSWLQHRFIPRGLPVVTTLHHSIHDPTLRPYKGWLRNIYHRWWIAPNERRVLRRSDQIIAVSKFVADIARQILCDLPMKVIYNGINTEIFCPDNKIREPNEPCRLLYVGAWKQLKGVDLLAPIMEKLGKGFKLYYTGGPTVKKNRLSMPSNMHDLGRLSESEVISAMQNADIFIFPSHSEGLPLATIEAMACGLPVIGLQRSSVTEVVSHGVNGMLCPHDDIPALVTAVHQLAENRHIHQDMRRNARREVELRFSEISMLNNYVHLYQKMTGERT